MPPNRPHETSQAEFGDRVFPASLSAQSVAIAQILVEKTHQVVQNPSNASDEYEAAVPVRIRGVFYENNESPT